MRIDGAGGCFDNRIYEINNKSAWNLLLLTVNEMGVTVDSRDDENGILECHNDKKVMRFSAQAMDEETTQVFADVHGKRIQVYNWKPQDKEVNLFTTYLKTSCVNTGPLSFVPAVRPKSVRL